jgi:hypothetical protein
MAGHVVKSIWFRAVRYVPATVNGEGPGLSARRIRVGFKVGIAFAIRTTVSRGEWTGEVLTEHTGLALILHRWRPSLIAARGGDRLDVNDSLGQLR